MGGNIEYHGSFNLGSEAGQLISTIDKTIPNRGALQTGRLFYRPAVSPIRRLRAVNVTFSIAASQTFEVSIVDNNGTKRVIASAALSEALQAFFEPEHEISIGGSENFQVDITATGSPAITGTIVIFTDEQ